MSRWHVRGGGSLVAAAFLLLGGCIESTGYGEGRVTNVERGLEAGTASGVLSGTLLFYNNQGGFCPEDRDCEGAHYVAADFNVYRPVRDTKVFLRDELDTVIGQGVSDEAGRFQIAWYRADGAPESATLVWRAEHRDGRFVILNSEGEHWAMGSEPFELEPGSTEEEPQETGKWFWGNSASPNPLANFYDSGTTMWNSLAASPRMKLFYTGVNIVAYLPEQCPTGCAVGPRNLVVLDSARSAYSPQSRLLHEMGHLASFRASRDQEYRQIGIRDGVYSWPENISEGSWWLNTPEWGSAQFEEGLATFLGDCAFYGPAAAHPTSCNAAAAACDASSFDTEASSGAQGGVARKRTVSR